MHILNNDYPIRVLKEDFNLSDHLHVLVLDSEGALLFVGQTTRLLYLIASLLDSNTDIRVHSVSDIENYRNESSLLAPTVSLAPVVTLEEYLQADKRRKEVANKEFEEWSKEQDRVTALIEKRLAGGETLQIEYSVATPPEATAFEGESVLYAESWGDPEGVDAFTVMDSPTWLDIAVEFNRMILITKDYHHIFLEGILYTKAPEGSPRPDLPHYKLSLGS